MSGHILITTHPERWYEDYITWLSQLLMESFKNKIKKFIYILKRIRIVMSNKRTIPQIIKGLWIRFLHHFARHIFPSKIRVAIHRLRGVRIGKNVLIGVDVHIDDNGTELVTIEDNVFLTSGCILITHKRSIKTYRKGMWIGDCPFEVGPITIRQGAHIGVRSIILPGITIGRGAVIGAGSIVTKDIPDFCIAMGNPARVVKTVEV